MSHSSARPSKATVLLYCPLSRRHCNRPVCVAPGHGKLSPPRYWASSRSHPHATQRMKRISLDSPGGISYNNDSSQFHEKASTSCSVPDPPLLLDRYGSFSERLIGLRRKKTVTFYFLLWFAGDRLIQEAASFELDPRALWVSSLQKMHIWGGWRIRYAGYHEVLLYKQKG